MKRRDLLKILVAVPAIPAAGQGGPEEFRVYSDAPRLFLRPARLRLLRRERERRSLRWDQFETLWTAAVRFPEFGWTAALRYQITSEAAAATQAILWAAGPATDVRQIALICDW